MMLELDQLRTVGPGGSVDQEIASAMRLAHSLTDLTADAKNLASIGEAFDLLNVRLFLNFHDVKAGKRLLRKPAGGVVTFGNAPGPVQIYSGPTDRRRVKK